MTDTETEAAPPAGDIEGTYLDFIDQLDKSYRQSLMRAGAVVVSGLIVTASLVVFALMNERSVRDSAFDDATFNATQVVENRVNSYTDLLYGLRSYLAVTDDPNSRAGFTQYVQSSDVEARFPGTQALGLARSFPAGSIPGVEEAVRAEGFPDYDVHPDTGNPEVVPVVFLEPVQGNEPAFGFDVANDDAGRQAVDLARDSAVATSGNPLVLGDQRALVVFLGYYASGGVPPEPDRAAQFEGVVLGIYFLGGAADNPGMMTDVLGPEPEVNLEIYDSGPAAAPALLAPDDTNLLYDSDDELDGIDPGSAPNPHRQVNVDVLNRRWTIFYTPGPGFSSGGSLLPWILGLSGILVTGLLGALVVALARSRRRAADLAEQMTESLVGRERELSQANANMVRSNTDLERYATIAAHDLQEPLRSILAYADLLQRKHGEDMTEEVNDYVVRMSQAAQRMRTLVTDLLAYARLEQKERRDERVDLSDCVRAAIGDLNFLIEDTGATIEVDRLPMVYGSSREIIGVFSNLLSNALKYRAPDRAPVVRIFAERQGNEWVIAVADNGLGIAPDYHMRIFELFRRLGPRDDNSGTGLGLAICARTIAQHGGRIWVESVEGEGATFWFTLPVKRDDRVATRAGAAR